MDIEMVNRIRAEERAERAETFLALAEAVRDDLAATLETRNAELTLAHERIAELTRAVAAEREACAGIADASARLREKRLRTLEAEGLSPHDPARLCLSVASTDAVEIAREIRARGEGGR